MKKFLVLPIVLAIGFAILVIINTESTGGNKEDESDYVTTKSGLKYKDEKVGDGKEAKPGARVVVHYAGRLKNGQEFDSSYKTGKPAEFSLRGGPGGVIQGWVEGIPGMKVGGKRKLIVPSELGYGKGGFPPDIPPDAELRFEVELVDVK